jgi:hypothetical protein
VTAPACSISSPEAQEGNSSAPLRLKRKIKEALVALSLSNLCFLNAWFHLLATPKQAYHHRPVTLSALAAMGCNLIGLALVIWLIMRALHRTGNRVIHFICHVCFLLLLLPAIDVCRVYVLRLDYDSTWGLLKNPAIIIALLAGVTLVLRFHRQVVRAAALGLGIFSPLAIFTLARIGLFALGLAGPAQPPADPALPALNALRAGQPHVLWIIFDEMDQRLAFEQRPAGLKLPEFDRLRSGSTYATNAFPPGYNTLTSIPALISGRQVADARPNSAANLTLTLADSGEQTNWSQLPSVFTAARALGANTALVGWYHAYPRMLAPGLNYCAWHPEWEPARAPTFFAAALRQIDCLGADLHGLYDYEDSCRLALAESRSVTRDVRYGLVFLHLPLPHLPGIYEPKTGHFAIFNQSLAQGYFNNLCLADVALGQFRRILEHAGRWEKTWVIVSADHSWRASERYDSQRDLRVPFLVKAAGPAKGTVLTNQFNTLLTHDFILSILRRDVTNQSSALAWLKAHAVPLPPVPNPAGQHRDRASIFNHSGVPR